jgi:hypothetical protein
MGSFDLNDPNVLLRLACGLFFIPHIAGKLVPPRPALNFFKAVRFPAPRGPSGCGTSAAWSTRCSGAWPASWWRCSTAAERARPPATLQGTMD